MSSESFVKKLKHIYNKRTYFQKYGGDLWLCFILIVIFSSLSTYFSVSGKINSIKPDWDKNKCNPKYMPFAGVMNKDKNVSALEYTENNFISCIGDVFKEIFQALLAPILLAIQTFENAIIAMVDLFNSMASAISDMIKFFIALLGTLMNIIGNITTVISHVYNDFIHINNKVNAISGVISNIAESIFTAFASIVATVFRVLINICKEVIGISVAAIILGIAWIIYGIFKTTEGGEEEASGSAGLPFTAGLLAKGIADMIRGILKVVMGIARLIPGIILLILALLFLALLLLILEYIVNPVFDIVSA
tara:strand:- start:645 stop:1565 length:921 start_codon:yes stop_codon:yes gene_type:complete